MAWASDVRIPHSPVLHVEVHLARLRAVDRDRVEVERVLGRELEPDRGRARVPRRVQPVKRHVFARRAVAVVDEPPRRRRNGGRERGDGVRGDDGRFSREHIVLVLHEVPTLAVRVRVEAGRHVAVEGDAPLEAEDGVGEEHVDGRERAKRLARVADVVVLEQDRGKLGKLLRRRVAVEQRVALERDDLDVDRELWVALVWGNVRTVDHRRGRRTVPLDQHLPDDGAEARVVARGRAKARYLGREVRQHGHGQARRFRRRRQAADARGGHVRDLSLVAAAPAVAGDGSRQREPPRVGVAVGRLGPRRARGVERHDARRARRRLEMRLERLRRGRAEARRDLVGGLGELGAHDLDGSPLLAQRVRLDVEPRRARGPALGRAENVEHLLRGLGDATRVRHPLRQVAVEVAPPLEVRDFGPPLDGLAARGRQREVFCVVPALVRVPRRLGAPEAPVRDGLVGSALRAPRRDRRSHGKLFPDGRRGPRGLERPALPTPVDGVAGQDGEAARGQLRQVRGEGPRRRAPAEGARQDRKLVDVGQRDPAAAARRGREARFKERRHLEHAVESPPFLRARKVRRGPVEDVRRGDAGGAQDRVDRIQRPAPRRRRRCVRIHVDEHVPRAHAQLADPVRQKVRQQREMVVRRDDDVQGDDVLALVAPVPAPGLGRRVAAAVVARVQVALWLLDEDAAGRLLRLLAQARVHVELEPRLGGALRAERLQAQVDVRRRRLEELASRENAVAVAVQAREGIAERRAARREPRDGRILVVRHAQSLVVARPPRVPRLERLRRDGGLGGNQMWGRRRAGSSRKLSARRRGGAGRLPLDAASAAASSPGREFLEVSPTHRLSSARPGAPPRAT